MLDIGVRFSSPVLDDEDIKLLGDTFKEQVDDVVDVIDSAPYEISIIACLLKRLDYKLSNYISSEDLNGLK